jgi:hypothetical protein
VAKSDWSNRGQDDPLPFIQRDDRVHRRTYDRIETALMLASSASARFFASPAYLNADSYRLDLIIANGAGGEGHQIETPIYVDESFFTLHLVPLWRSALDGAPGQRKGEPSGRV